MATEQRLLNYGFSASGDLSAKQYCGVVIGSTGIATATAAKNIDGILQDKPNAAGVSGEVAMFGVSKALSAGTGFAAGDLLEIVTGGGFQTQTSTNTVVAKAVTAAAAGAVGTVIILKSNAVFA
jgi:hypothetical protein